MVNCTQRAPWRKHASKKRAAALSIGWIVFHPLHHFSPPRVAESWQGTGESEKLQGCLENLRFSSIHLSSLLLFVHSNLKTFCWCMPEAAKWKTLKNAPPLTQGCNWQPCEVVADCQIDPRVTTWGMLGILRLAFPPLAIIHFVHDSWRGTYGRD